MNIATVPASLFAAVAPFMAKKDVRYYLNGLLLTRSDTGLRAVATDGHALAICDAPGIGPESAAIVPRDAVEWAIKAGGEVTLSWDGLDATATASNGASLPFKMIDGRFPDYQAVVPMLQDDRTKMPAFNPDILGLFAKSKAALKNAGVTNDRNCALTLHGNGLNNAIGAELSGLGYGFRLIGVIMPMRDSAVGRAEFRL